MLQSSGAFPSSNISVSYTETTADPDDEAQGWHLAGNPYPYSINWVDLVADGALSNIIPVVFFYDPTMNSGQGGYRINYGYDIPTMPTIVKHDGVIEPYQAFWVRTTGNNTSGTINFKESHRTDDIGTLYAKTAIAGNKTVKQNPYLAFSVVGGDVTESALIAFDDKEEIKLDRPFALSTAHTDFGFAEDNKLYVFEQVKGFGDLELPLHFNTDNSGSYTISLAGLEEWEIKPEVYLFDKITGTTTQLTAANDYSFDWVKTQKVSSKSKNVDSLEILNTQTASEKYDDARFTVTIKTGTGVSAEQETDLPENFGLSQNYPNPFNPSTVISYQLPENGMVRLQVFDMLGREVATLVDGRISAGEHSVTFDAGNLSSGVYIYRLQAGNNVFTKKLTLIK